MPAAYSGGVGERVTVDRDGHVLMIGLNRPDKRNAADFAMLQELCLAYGELDRDDSLRAGVVFAHGDRFWHGHPEPLACPEGVARQSLAAYYYVADGSPAAEGHSAIWAPRG